MKFRNGYWLLKENVSLLPHAQYVDSNESDTSLEVFASTKRVERKGDTLNTGLITTTLTPWNNGVIKVEVYHHKGVDTDSPCFSPEYPSQGGIISKNSVHAGDLCASLVDNTIRFHYVNKTLFSRKSEISGYMKVGNQPYMAEYLAVSPTSLFFGLGERFTPFVKNGQSVEIWNEDGGTSSEQAYKNIPFLISSEGYGIFIDTYGKICLEIESEVVDAVQFSVTGERLSYYVIAGKNTSEVLSRYTLLTGRVPILPKWSYGLWLSTSFTTDYSENTVTSFLDGMERRGIKVSVFHFDCFWMNPYEWVSFQWNKSTFPDPIGMISRLHKRGIRVCLWINPYIGQKSPLFDEAKNQGFLLKRKDESIYQTDMWQSGMGIVDFTNPNAAKWYKQKLRELINQGVDTFKTDFGERIPTDVIWYDGSSPEIMHNYYSLLYNKTVYDLLKELKGDDAVVFARSSTIGGQKYPVHWGGDCSASYSSMAETLRGGLSLALSGFSYWSHDIGGFENTATPDLYKRWIAFGLLSTHSRLHGSSTYRVPWMFDEESEDVLRFFVNLKYSLLPYIMEEAKNASQTGIPIMRPMVIDYADDRNAVSLDTQYFLGKSLLVSPIMNEDGLGICYLPKGKWISLLDKEIIEGPTWIEKKYDYFSLPLFVKENSIILRSYSDKKTAELYLVTDAVTNVISAMKTDSYLKIYIYDSSIQTAKIYELNNSYEIPITGNEVIIKNTDLNKYEVF